ncbi:MAG: Flp pilus assembly complex ATPase component TadA [Planctomycetes bacterium]|nr:Flp pilus assembly complex ATPase component TadA [Planctomycetota bacterium]
MRPSAEYRKKLLGRILKDMDLVTESQIQEALAVQNDRGGAIGGILVQLGYIDEDDLTIALAKQSGMEVVDLEAIEIPNDVINRVSSAIAHSYRIVPIRFENGVLTVALADPTNLKTLDDLRFLLNCEIAGAASNEKAVNMALDNYYSAEEDVEGILEELGDEFGDVEEIGGDESESIDLQSLEEMAESAPVRRLLNLVLLQAIQDRASDIHFEPFEDEFKIRYRVDGVLYEMVPPPRHLHVAIATRIKAMSGMNIAERRRPQDGRVELNISGNPVDLRISTLPTMFGESIVCRVLDRRQVALDLDKIGLRTDDMEEVQKLINKPHGIVLCTGPTGCGKTTTLYSILRELNQVGIKILTAEDPVEYDIEGIMQMEIKNDIGVTFAGSLRRFLRQDPDIILIGEIRDLDTAQIAVQASLTGHVVFSTSHTNDGATAITRLIDLGLEPYLINATLEGIIAQRLVRKICTNCKELYEPSAEHLLQVGLKPEDVEGKEFYRGRGCQVCNNIGYKGRLGVFEIVRMNDELRELMMTGASTGELRACARKYGARSLRDSGLLAVYDGKTTIEEVARATVTEK